jgi:hypothetical protein
MGLPLSSWSREETLGRWVGNVRTDKRPGTLDAQTLAKLAAARTSYAFSEQSTIGSGKNIFASGLQAERRWK